MNGKTTEIWVKNDDAVIWYESRRFLLDGWIPAATSGYCMSTDGRVKLVFWKPDQEETMTELLKPINREDRLILDLITSLWVESGGSVLYDPSAHGLNSLFPSKSGAVEVCFDYDVPEWLKTRNGKYTFGFSTPAEAERFWAALTEAFDVTVLSPKRDDKALRATLDGEISYQRDYSGPVVALTLKSPPVARNQGTNQEAESDDAEPKTK